jgi:hypothetical protein
MSKRTRARTRLATKPNLSGSDRSLIDVDPRAPVVIPQIHQPKPQDIIARPPVIDRYPIVIGANLTGQYVSSCFRLCNSGWRYQFVDLINELLECDPDARGPVRARVLGVACGKHDVLPADIPKDDPDYPLAKEIANRYGEQFKAIPKLQQRTAQLLWGDIYGVSSQEILWDLTGGKNWDIIGLSSIHSRRLNYPNPTSWDLYIYDQGLVGPGVEYMGPTTGVFGLRVTQFPAKFIVHTPALNGDYPTRDGEGRFIAYNMLFKRLLMRATAQDFERVIKPRVLGYFNRRLSEGTTRSIANPEDEAMLFAVTNALASGGMISGVLPDSTKVQVLKDAAAMSATEWLNFLVRGYAKSLIGQSFTTEPGANGNLATAEQAAKDTQKIFRYSARCLCDTLEEDLARPWMQLNYPDAPRRVMPRHQLLVDEQMDPAVLSKMVGEAAHTMPEYARRVDIDDLGERTGVKMLSEDDARPLPAPPATIHGTPPRQDGEPGNMPPTPKNGAGKDSKINSPPIETAPKTETN